MTRAERAAKDEAELLLAKEALTKKIAEKRAVVREEARKQRDARRMFAGTLLDEARLLAWSDADLAAVIEALAVLRDVPQPGKVLASLLDESPARKRA